MLIEDGLVVIMTRYHKGMSTTGKQKVVHRYLPREVGELVVYYVWLVLPFWHLLRAAGTKGKAEAPPSYLWQPASKQAWAFPTRPRAGWQGGGKRKVEGSRRKKAAHKSREGHARVRSTLSVGPESDEQLDEKQASEWWDMDEWGTNRVTRALQEVSMQYMGVKIGILAWRHATKAIFRRYMGSNSAETKQVVETDDMMEDGEVGIRADAVDAMDQASAKQTGHGVLMGDGIYGRGIQESAFSRPGDRGLFRRVSRAWHGFLMMPSSMGEAVDGTAHMSLQKMMQGAGEVARMRWQRTRRVDAQKELREMMGENAEFRSVQERALRAIMQQQTPVVVIMGTGAGKSVLFMLPARCSEGVTIVITPLVALRGNMKQRCDELGISSVEWEAGRPDQQGRLVFVTPESATKITFWN